MENDLLLDLRKFPAPHAVSGADAGRLAGLQARTLRRLAESGMSAPRMVPTPKAPTAKDIRTVLEHAH